jgi:formylglycine-generating enzyme required for sulfatase activity
VNQVNHLEAEEFCIRLARYGRGIFTKFRLPTEAEWEYACRAGTRSPFHFGAILNGAEANCNGSYPYGTSNKGTYLKRECEVGQYGANALGLHDMHGNVWEWCMDWYGEYATIRQQDPAGFQSVSARVIRGGGWDAYAWRCRAARRDRRIPTRREDNLGFRVALVP